MTEPNIEKLLDQQEKEIKRLQKEIDRLLEELHLIEKYENREYD